MGRGTNLRSDTHERMTRVCGPTCGTHVLECPPKQHSQERDGESEMQRTSIPDSQRRRVLVLTGFFRHPANELAGTSHGHVQRSGSFRQVSSGTCGVGSGYII